MRAGWLVGGLPPGGFEVVLGRLQQRGGIAVPRMLLLDRSEHLRCLLPALLVEVVERLGIPVGELGLADLCLRVRDDATRVGVVRVVAGQLGGRGHDRLPLPA